MINDYDTMSHEEIKRHKIVWFERFLEKGYRITFQDIITEAFSPDPLSREELTVAEDFAMKLRKSVWSRCRNRGIPFGHITDLNELGIPVTDEEYKTLDDNSRAQVVGRLVSNSDTISHGVSMKVLSPRNIRRENILTSRIVSDAELKDLLLNE